MLLLGPPAQGAGPVVIDEVLAQNARAVEVAGRFPDFVELHNASADPVNLGGSALVDDGEASTPLVFPAGTFLGPGERLVVWCDRDPGLPAPQAGFGIGSAGDRIRLTGPSGEVWDEVSFGLQAADYSLGRVESGDLQGGPGIWRLTQPTPGNANVAARLGDPAKLRINEWMAAPAAGDDWIELFNSDTLPVDLSGAVFTDRNLVPPANRPIPAHSFIAPRGFVQFFASDLRQADADHLDFRLSADGEQLTLYASDRATRLDRVVFGPLGSNLSGGRTPDGGEILMVFAAGQSTPGAPNGRELTRVLISEVLSHSDPPFEDAIELHNPTAEPVAIGHWWLSDAASAPRKFRIPAGTVIGPGAYLVFYEYQFGAGPDGFGLNSYEGDEVWLSVGDREGNLTGEVGGVRFGALKNGVSVGRVETSAGADFAPLQGTTFGVDAPGSISQFRQGQGAANAPPRRAEVVLGEWFFAGADATGGARGERFVELHHPGGVPVPLFDPLFPTNAWRVRGDLRFDLPPGLTLSPGARLVLVEFDPAADPARLAAFRVAFGLPETLPILGPLQGRFETGGGALELQAPDFPEGADKPRPGFVPYVRVDRIEYRPGAGWPAIAKGAGLALRRVDPLGHGNEPQSWTLDTPSPGAELPADADRDTDGDRMPDAWEELHGFDSVSPGDASGDADFDGSTNLDEFRAGTDPRNANDVLRAAIRRTAGAWLRVEFATVQGRRYQVEGRPLGGPGAWAPISEPVRPSEPGTAGVEIPRSDSPMALRLSVSMEP